MRPFGGCNAFISLYLLRHEFDDIVHRVCTAETSPGFQLDVSLQDNIFRLSSGHAGSSRASLEMIRSSCVSLDPTCMSKIMCMRLKLIIVVACLSQILGQAQTSSEYHKASLPWQHRVGPIFRTTASPTAVRGEQDERSPILARVLLEDDHHLEPFSVARGGSPLSSRRRRRSVMVMGLALDEP